MAFELAAGVPVKKELKKNKKRWWEMYKEKQPKKVEPPKEVKVVEEENKIDELPKGALDLRSIDQK